MSENLTVVPVERIEKAILYVRGEKVMLDSVLAELYEVETWDLNRAVKRNIDRFPADFMFQLTDKEWESLSCQFGSSNLDDNLKSQTITTKSGRGGRRYLPYVFTEQGVAMLSSVLKSERAVNVNIDIMRAFVRLRQMIASNRELAKRLDELENKYDSQFRIVFDAIRQLMTPAEKEIRKIGFRK
jgi:hypothetical protein